ncbi:MAG: hypothetical protein DMF61_24945 [Blastocatellia bacterium AA13]|nr:MAG: hypothetical protein DMF61_24945 [Blastocatellia bacterium AA13]
MIPFVLNASPRSSEKRYYARANTLAFRRKHFCDSLPKIMAICKQFGRCGKEQCRCNSGRLHGPYYYEFYIEDGRLRKRYIRKADGERAFAMYSLYRERQKKRAADRREFTEMSRELRSISRMFTQLDSLIP